MLQLIDTTATTCSPAFQPTPVQPSAQRHLGFVIAVVLSIAAVSAPVAFAQSSSNSTPADSATSQTGTPTSQTGTPTSQTGAPTSQTGTKKAPVAAPGTVAVTAATAAALQPYTGPKYDNRWEVYGGLLFMNDQAGQVQPNRRFNMGGAEAMGTYWLGDSKHGPLSKLGVAVDGRFGAGTTPVLSPYYNRVVIMESVFMGGLEYRGPKNRYAAVDFHVMGGGDYGDFSYAVTHYPGGSRVSACAADQQIGQTGNLGLYCNHVAPYGVAGGSIDFNESAKLAIRLQPDLMFERFGTETREYFSISLGAVYRFGVKGK